MLWPGKQNKSTKCGMSLRDLRKQVPNGQWHYVDAENLWGKMPVGIAIKEFISPAALNIDRNQFLGFGRQLIKHLFPFGLTGR